ncbi:hypothetical protein, variant [Saprolegnia diclina VS20]|nr:hypothetical protein, variant [Saprolegnia diclina VS20]EQC33792.1 hypothetical protein, variant [Saprolegnia diclina VS20]|eukprot:XP_008612587.1 hypothetical protein, variant [Saprolegnia diclina VS20]
MQSFRDNMLGQNIQNMVCSWRIQPTRVDGATTTSFDAIWLTFASFQLGPNAVVTVYDGPDTSSPVLVQARGGQGSLATTSFSNNQGVMFVTYASNNAPSTPGFTINWQAAYCPKGCSGAHGSCVGGACICVHGWAGAACDIPQGWLCESTHYNTTDGCDCGCGLYDPDCGALANSVVACQSAPSLTNTAFNASQGRLPTGTCIYCPLPLSIPEQVMLPQTSWNTTDGSLDETCPSVHQCGVGAQCDAGGSCVRVAPTASIVLEKQCDVSSDCPGSTLCLNHICTSDLADFGLVFADASLVASRCQLVGLNTTTGVTIEATVRIASRNATDVLLSYPGLALGTSSGLTVSITTETWPTTIAIDTGRWYSVAVTWQASDATTSLYFVNATANTSTLMATTQLLNQGVSLLPLQTLLVGGFHGAMSYLRLWNTVRDPATLFQPTLAADRAALVAEYRFLDGSARDLSIYQNDLSLAMTGINPLHPSQSFAFAFGASPAGSNPCTELPVVLADGFPANSALLVSAVPTGNNWSVGFYTASDTAILEVSAVSAAQVEIAVDGTVVTTLAAPQILDPTATLALRFQRIATLTMQVCIADVYCATVALPPARVFASFALADASDFASLCVSTASTLAALAAKAVLTTTTTAGGTCSFPMVATQRDCALFATYVAGTPYRSNDVLLAARIYAYANLDQSTQPCTCSVMPTWVVQHAILQVDSAAHTFLTRITYTTIKTKTTPDATTVSCGNNCYIYDPATPWPAPPGQPPQLPSSAQGTAAKQYPVARGFTVSFNSATNAWSVVNVTLAGDVPTAQCLVTGPDAGTVLVSYTALACLTLGASTLDATTSTPWCLVNGQQHTCMSESNPCGLVSGTATRNSTSGSISDGYETTATSGVHTCRYTIAPDVPLALRPYTRILLTVQQLQLSANDAVLVTDTANNIALTSTLSGAVDWATLASIVANTSSVMVEYDSVGDKSGTAYDGFFIEYDAFYTFPNAATTHFCHAPSQTLLLNAATMVFPTTNLSSATSGINQTQCSYVFAAPTPVSSLWLSFLEINLTDANGGAGDYITLYDVAPTPTLLANVSAMSFVQPNYALVLSGVADYSISTSPLPALPTTIVFWLYAASTIKADCTVAANCVNAVPKKMKVMASASSTPLAAYFTVQLAVDTGYLSLVVSDVEFTATTTSVLVDTWLHVAFVHQPSQNDVFAYIDGVRQVVARTGAVNDTLTTPMDALFTVGGDSALPDTDNIFFAGSVRQLRLYNSSKTMLTLQRMRTSACDITDASLLLCYEYGAPNITMVMDASRFGIHSQLHGGASGSATYSSMLPFTVFTSSSSQLELRYVPSSAHSTTTFRVLVQGMTCPSSCNNGTCVRGACVCAPGYTGAQCESKTNPCLARVLLPSRRGVVAFPPPQVPSAMVPARPRLGYPPLQCAWHFAKTNAIVVFEVVSADVETTDTVTIYDGAASSAVYYDGTSNHNLSAATAVDRALFLQQSTTTMYQVEIFQHVATYDATVALRRTTSIDSCHPTYDIVRYRRGQTCVDASVYGLPQPSAISLATAYWWTKSRQAYQTHLTVGQMYFNAFDNTTANTTIEYTITSLDNATVVASPYPTSVRFAKRTETFMRCMDGADVGLDVAASIIAGAWPSRLGRTSIASVVASYADVVAPMLSYVGNWTYALQGLVRLDFATTSARLQSRAFTLLINASVVLTNSEQYLVAQENCNLGSLVLKVTAAAQSRGQWVFGAYGINAVASMSPTVFSGDTVSLAVTYEAGVVTYFLNGVRYGAYDTNTAYRNCLATRAKLLAQTGSPLLCVAPITGFADASRLTLGARLVAQQLLNNWRGAIYSVHIFSSVLPDAVVASLYTGVTALGAFQPQMTYINAVDGASNGSVSSSTRATLSAIEVLSVPVGATTVTSTVVRQWTLRRLGCATPPADYGLNATVLASLIGTANVVFNAFDATSAIVSWDMFQQQATLTRTRVYAFGLNDSTIVQQLTAYSASAEPRPYRISTLWVNTVSNSSAVVTFQFPNALGTLITAATELPYTNASWTTPTTVVRVVPPAFAEVTDTACAPQGPPIKSPSGVLATGQLVETQLAAGNTQCRWVLQPTGVDTVTVVFEFLHVVCAEGSLTLSAPSRPTQNVCGLGAGTRVTLPGPVTITYATAPVVTLSTGFYATYTFASLAASINATLAPSSYSPWAVQSTSRPGIAQCQLDDSTESAAQPWQVVHSTLDAAFNYTCYNYTWLPPDYAWIVSAFGDTDGVTDCSTWTADESAPWTAYATTTVNATALYSAPATKASASSLRFTSGSSRLFSTSMGQGEVALASTTGGRGSLEIRYYLPRVYYVAPASYQAAASGMGLGTRESPYTYTFAYLFANILADGDLLRAFPGRYEGSGYCNLVITKSFHIESLSGSAYTVVSCGSSTRGWQLQHTSGLTVVRGLTFTKCLTTVAPLLGSALYIAGRTTVDQCRFTQNAFLGQGTVAVVAPSTATLTSCVFDANVANYGSAVAILSAIATIIDCSFVDNNATSSGAVLISTYTVGAVALVNPSVVTMVGGTFTRNRGLLVTESALSIVLKSIVTINDTRFVDNFGAAVAVNSASLYIFNATFRGNQGSGLRLSSAVATVVNASFFDNTGAPTGGAILAQASRLNCSASTFERNQATTFGGAIYLTTTNYTGSSNAYVNNSVPMQSVATKGLGGAMYVINCFDNSLTPVVLIANATFAGNAATSGAAVHITQSYVSVARNRFTTNLASKSGGSVRVTMTVAQDSEVVVLLQDNVHSNNSAKIGASVYLDSSDHVRVERDVFRDGFAQQYGGALAASGATDVVLESVFFQQCVAGVGGGAIYVEGSSAVSMQHTVFDSCASLTDGGSLYVTSSVLTLASGRISNTSAVGSGGAIVLMNRDTTATISNTSIRGASAAKGGALYVIDCSLPLGAVTNLSIIDASASLLGGGMYLVLANVVATYLQATRTSAGSGGLVASQDSVLQLHNATIDAASASSNGGAFYSILSTLALFGCDVRGHSAGAYGGALYSFASVVAVRSSVIDNCTAASGGGAYVASSSVTMTECTISNNRAATGGGFCADVSNVTTTTSTWVANRATGTGGAIYFSSNAFAAVNSLFVQNVAVQGGAIALVEPTNATAHGCNFTANAATASSSALASQGGAIYLIDAQGPITLTDTTFLRNAARVMGGALYMTSAATSSTYPVGLTTTVFTSNEAAVGGALYASNINLALAATTHANNEATNGGGGAIFWLTLEPSGISSQTYIGNSASYGANYASSASGLLPQYTPLGSATATETGEASGANFVGTMLVSIVDKYLQTVTTDSSSSVVITALTTNALVVGSGKATAVAGVCDFATSGVQATPGHDVSFAFTSPGLTAFRNVTMHVRACRRGEVTPSGVNECVQCPFGQFSWNTSETTCHKCPTGAICGGGDAILAIAGYWRFPNSTGICTSGYDDCALIECLTSACNGVVAGADTAMINVNGPNETSILVLPAGTSDYEFGDTLLLSTFTFPVLVVGTKATDDNMQLYVTGSGTLTHGSTVTLYRVANETCADGYSGHLCNQCADGYTRSGKSSCISCPNNLTLTLLVLVGGIVACVVLSVGLIFMTMRKSNARADTYSILSKIFTSYLQLVSLAGSFELKWPSQVVSMFNVQSAVSNPTAQLISIECAMGYYRVSSHLPTYFEQLILYLCLPILCILAPLAFWQFVYFRKQRTLRKTAWLPPVLAILDVHPDPIVDADTLPLVLAAVKARPSPTCLLNLHERLALPQPLSMVKAAYIAALRQEIHDKTVVSVIVLMFLVHPGVTKVIFELFTCTQLGVDSDGDARFFMDPDLDVACYDSSHYRWMLFVGVPSLIVYTLGIPAYALYTLHKHRDTLEDPRTKLQLGFLFDGYKTQYYYWEIWVMMRKVLVSAVSVFLKNWGTPSQSLGATGLTFLALYLHMDRSPYEAAVINNLEEMSLLTCLFTLYCGLYLFQSVVTGWLRIFLGVIVVVVNCLFLIKFGRLMSVEIKRKAVHHFQKVAHATKVIKQVLGPRPSLVADKTPP